MLYIWSDFYIVEKFFSQQTRNDSSATVPSDFYIRVYISHIHGYVVHVVYACVATHDNHASYLAMILAKHFVKPGMRQFIARIVPQILAVASWTSARAVAYIYSQRYFVRNLLKHNALIYILHFRIQFVMILSIKTSLSPPPFIPII